MDTTNILASLLRIKLLSTPPLKSGSGAKPRLESFEPSNRGQRDGVGSSYRIGEQSLCHSVQGIVNFDCPAKRRRALLESNSSRDSRARQRQMIAPTPRKANPFRGPHREAIIWSASHASENSGAWGRAPEYIDLTTNRKVHFTLNQNKSNCRYGSTASLRGNL